MARIGQQQPSHVRLGMIGHVSPRWTLARSQQKPMVRGRPVVVDALAASDMSHEARRRSERPIVSLWKRT
jgi:hypothetical protein